MAAVAKGRITVAGREIGSATGPELRAMSPVVSGETFVESVEIGSSLFEAPQIRGRPPAAQGRIAEALVERTLQAGAPFIAAGEVRPSLLIVGEGLIRRTRVRHDQVGFVEERYVATQTFGRRAVLSGLPYPAPVRAVTQSLVLELTRASLAAVLQAHPEIRAPLAANLARSPMRDITYATEVSALEGRTERPVAFYLGLLQTLAPEAPPA